MSELFSWIIIPFFVSYGLSYFFIRYHFRKAEKKLIKISDGIRMGLTYGKAIDDSCTPKQLAIIKSWSKDITDSNGEFMYPSTAFYFLPMPDGTHVVCLERFLFTVAISVLDGEMSRERRWCYPDLCTAFGEYTDWAVTNFEGEPKNYIVAK